MTTKYRPMHPLKRLKKIRRECRQIINDIEWWNRNRTDSEPIDCEPERIMLAKADAAIKAWGKPEFGDLCTEVAKYGMEIKRELDAEAQA